MKFTDELTLLLKARYPIIYINTIEEDRVEYIIRKYIKTSLWQTSTNCFFRGKRCGDFN